MSRLNLLLLCDFQRDGAATVSDHINALTNYSRHSIRKISILGDLPRGLDLSRFDGVIIHYSLIACHNSYVSAETRRRLAAFDGLKAIFIQDEYRFVDQTIAAMREIGINLLFTCFPASEIEKVYSEEKLPGVTKVNVLTGYVPEALLGRNVQAPSLRTLDIGYRGRTLPAWYGELGQEKFRIGERVKTDASQWNLTTDISSRESDRLYGRRWIKFVSSCRTMLGVESGASVIDFTGEVQSNVTRAQAENPSLSFDELKAGFFADLDGKILLNQISPRCFECAALKTPMILYDGEYSGILKPHRHYIPLRKDHSNMPEVVSAIRDGSRLDEMAERTYREVAQNPSYSFRASVQSADEQLSEAAARLGRSVSTPYGVTFPLAAFPTFRTFRRRMQRRVIGQMTRLSLAFK